MALNASKVRSTGNKVTQPLLEEGTYPARLVQVIGLGLQNRDAYAGVEKEPCYQIHVTYEMADEFMVDENGNVLEDKPRWLSERMNFFNLESDKATSTKRYLALDPTKEKGGDWAALVGSPVMVTVGHKEGTGKNVGRTFERIINTAKMREKDLKNLEDLKNPTLVFDALDEDPDIEAFNSLPQFLQDIIKNNLEFNGSALQAKLGGKAKAAAPADEEDEQPDDEPEY